MWQFPGVSFEGPKFKVEKKMKPNLPEEVQNEFEGGLSTGGIQLPMKVPYLWVKNGEVARKKDGGALYFGGWAVNMEEMDSICGEFKRGLPFGLKEIAVIPSADSSDKEIELNLYVSRAILFAPLAMRESSILKDGTRVVAFSRGGRPHTQVLGLLAQVDKDASVWGYAVLSAKGYQAGNVMDSIRKAQSAIKAACKKTEGFGLAPSNAFWMQLGTFSTKREAIKVGGGDSQSEITPIGVLLPEAINAEWLEKHYIGDDNVLQARDVMKTCREWLDAWKADNIGKVGVPRNLPEEPPDGIEERDSDIPF